MSKPENYCKSCSDPPSFDPDVLPFTGQQNSSGTDSLTCMVNSVLISLSNSITDLVGRGPISVDIGILNCIVEDKKDEIIEEINKSKTWRGSYEYAGNNDKVKLSIRILAYLALIGPKKAINIPITCSKEKQDIGKPCYSTNCFVKTKIILKTVTKSSTFNDIFRQICDGGASGVFVGDINGSPTALTTWLASQTTNPTGIPIWDITEDIFPGPNQSGTHAVTIINYECDGNNVLLTIQDSYTWGGDPKNNVMVYKIRVPKNSQLLRKGFPIQIGTGVIRIVSLKVSPISKQAFEEIFERCCAGICCKDGDCNKDATTERLCKDIDGNWKQAIKECRPGLCGTSPTPTPQPTPTPYFTTPYIDTVP